MRFPLLGLRDSPAKGIMFRGVAGISVVLVLVVGGIGLEGTLPWIWFASFGGMFIVVLYGLVWLLIITSGGYAEITESHLLVKANSGNESYPLKDIADVRLKRPWFGTVPYVEIRLRRTIRKGFWRNDHGTDIAGISTLYRKATAVMVEDAEGFAAELRRRLPPPGA